MKRERRSEIIDQARNHAGMALEGMLNGGWELDGAMGITDPEEVELAFETVANIASRLQDGKRA